MNIKVIRSFFRPSKYVSIPILFATATIILQSHSSLAGSNGERIGSMCSPELSVRAAEAARAEFPDPMPYKERSPKINRYLQFNVWKFFDPYREGYIDFDRFLASEWAGYLAEVPAGACKISKSEFLRRFLGEKSDPQNGWHNPTSLLIVKALYTKLDSHERGYFTIDDLRPVAREEFLDMDRDHDGRLSTVEFPAPK